MYYGVEHFNFVVTVVFRDSTQSLSLSCIGYFILHRRQFSPNEEGIQECVQYYIAHLMLCVCFDITGYSSW